MKTLLNAQRLGKRSTSNVQRSTSKGKMSRPNAIRLVKRTIARLEDQLAILDRRIIGWGYLVTAGKHANGSRIVGVDDFFRELRHEEELLHEQYNERLIFWRRILIKATSDPAEDTAF